MLQIDEHFWCCDFEVSFRGQLPRYVSVNGNRILITYEREFVAFVLIYPIQNASSKLIEGVYRVEDRQLVAVVPQRNNKCLVFYDQVVEAVTLSNNAISHCQRLLSLPSAITPQSIALSNDNAQFAILTHQESAASLYYLTSAGVTHVEVPATKALRLEEVFWLKERLIGVDSSLFFYDLTHEKELVQLQSDRKDSLSATEGEQMEAEEEMATYEQLHRRYLERQFKKDRTAVERNNQILGVTPSISACFQMLSPQLFL